MKYSNPMNNGPVTIRQVSSCDTVAFVARLLLIFVWVASLIMLVYMNLGGSKPKESPAEIVFILACFTAAFMAVILARRAKVEKLVREGTPVPATLSRPSRFQFFITVGVNFKWRGESIKRVVQLPAVRATEAIRDMERFTLMVDPEDHRRFVIRELYMAEQDS